MSSICDVLQSAALPFFRLSSRSVGEVAAPRVGKCTLQSCIVFLQVVVAAAAVQASSSHCLPWFRASWVTVTAFVGGRRHLLTASLLLSCIFC